MFCVFVIPIKSKSNLFCNKNYNLSRANSISWNPHKMAGAPLQCSVFMVRDKGLLHEANSAAAQYLFQQDKFYDVSYDTGDKSVQCGRKVRSIFLCCRGAVGLLGKDLFQLL